MNDGLSFCLCCCCRCYDSEDRTPVQLLNWGKRIDTVVSRLYIIASLQVKIRLHVVGHLCSAWTTIFCSSLSCVLRASCVLNMSLKVCDEMLPSVNVWVACFEMSSERGIRPLKGSLISVCQMVWVPGPIVPHISLSRLVALQGWCVPQLQWW